MSDFQLDALVATVLRSAKYQKLSPDLVRRVGAAEWRKRPRMKEAVKATKNRLHQIAGAYWQSNPDYGAALQLLTESAVSSDTLQTSCRQLMAIHRSTQERLPILDEFYHTILADLPPIRSVLDVACGLNPLSYLWFPRATEVVFSACDLYTDQIAFLNAYWPLAGLHGHATVTDIGDWSATNQVTADLILVLKTLPVLEQIEKGAASRLLDGLNGRFLLITFPARSLGGRPKGMVQNYETQFLKWVNGRGWQWQRFAFSSELAFLVDCQPESCE